MKAPEFPKDLRWFNSQPLAMKELRAAGNVVLIDFWTYSCVNCIRTLPHLKEWHKRYRDKGLVIIGVHTPEFEFEKDATNVERAIRAFGIDYPVVLDADYQLWSAYANRYWPNKYLCDKEGQIVYEHAGEGGYRETEENIRETLRADDANITLPEPAHLSTAPSTQEEETGGACYPGTPETYLGSSRGRQGHIWRYTGEWRVHPEYIEHNRTAEHFEDAIIINFEASEVNVVAEATGPRPAKVELAINGEHAGSVEIHEPKMYNLFCGHEMKKGELVLSVKDEGIRFYAFTFGTCTPPTDQKQPAKKL